LRREVNALAQLSPSSSDYAVIKATSTPSFTVPWAERPKTGSISSGAEEILDRAALRTGEGERGVLEFLAVLKLRAT